MKAGEQISFDLNDPVASCIDVLFFLLTSLFCKNTNYLLGVEVMNYLTRQNATSIVSKLKPENAFLPFK